MARKMVRPYSTAMASDRKLSSSTTMSAASLATSDPEPMAKPTSARLSADESLTPSPVIPTTRPDSCASRTRRDLSVGRARETTARRGSASVTSWSDMPSSSAEVRTSDSSRSRPTSPATADAVSTRSPVIMVRWMPAAWHRETARRDSGRVSSRMAMEPTYVNFAGNLSSASKGDDEMASETTRTPCADTSEMDRSMAARPMRTADAPSADTADEQAATSTSGAPLTSVAMGVRPSAWA
mmetsp:Transcript_955/g.2923  ORF Transcript_955/g.2923 Transcript_955/m.2923 type:complete len:240 (-) Transcript_955:1428-2147(-)